MPVTLSSASATRSSARSRSGCASAYRDARLAVIPGAGHAAHLEQPDAVAYQLGSPSSSASA